MSSAVYSMNFLLGIRNYIALIFKHFNISLVKNTAGPCEKKILVYTCERLGLFLAELLSIIDQRRKLCIVE